MARTQIRGNTQIMDASVNLSKLQNNFLAGTTWNVDAANGATITGLADPTNANDAVNKNYVDTMISTTAKGPDSWDASTNSYPSTYKGEAIVEGDPFVVTTDGIVDSIQYRIGDMVIANIDNPSTSSSSDWVSIQSNIDLASEATPGIIEIATQAETDAGTDDSRAITPLKLETYISNNDLDVTAGNGLVQNGKAFDVTAGNASLNVQANSVEVQTGNTNGTSLEVTATGVELASTITGERTFTQASGETFEISNTDANSVTLGVSPDGTVNLAVATVEYVNNKAPNIVAGDGLTSVTSSGTTTINIEAADNSIDIQSDNIAVQVGNTNGGASLEITATGVELASTIAGTRTFSGNVTIQNAFETQGATNLGGTTNANSARLGIQPDGTVDLAIATTKYVDDKVSAVDVPGAGDGLVFDSGNDEFDIVSANNGIVVNADNIELTVGNTNGTSLEITATGVELTDTITGNRTFSDNLTANSNLTVDGTSTFSGGTTASGNVTLGTNADQVTLVTGPTGNVDLAVATVKYVKDEIGVLSGDVIYNETPSVTDGSADVTLTNTPRTDTQRVYLNGVRQVPGASNDYTISGNTITFTDNLSSDDIVLVDYIYD